MLGLILIQTVWHSVGIPEKILSKSWFWKNSAADKKNTQNYSVGKEFSNYYFELSLVGSKEVGVKLLKFYFLKLFWIISYEEIYCGYFTLCMLGNFSCIIIDFSL